MHDFDLQTEWIYQITPYLTRILPGRGHLHLCNWLRVVPTELIQHCLLVRMSEEGGEDSPPRPKRKIKKVMVLSSGSSSDSDESVTAAGTRRKRLRVTGDSITRCTRARVARFTRSMCISGTEWWGKRQQRQLCSVCGGSPQARAAQAARFGRRQWHLGLGHRPLGRAQAYDLKC